MTNSSEPWAADQKYRAILDEVSEWRATVSIPRFERGDWFNPFTAITSPRDENRHSRVVATLLDPIGSHGQYATFLELFLEELGLTDFAAQPIDQAQWRVSTEVGLGNGGRIDILIEGPGLLLGVENKVDAEEGDGQLAGYAQELQRGAVSRPRVGSSQKRAVLVFLTPQGREPIHGRGAVHRAGLDDVVTCSYAKVSEGLPSLQAWLDQATERLRDAPPIQQFAIRYRDLVAEIGGNPMDVSEKRELAHRVITDTDAVRSARDLAGAFFERCVELHESFWSQLKEQLGDGVFYTANLDGRGLRQYVSGSGKVSLSMYYDTGLRWDDYRVVINIELMGIKHRNNLTWKVMFSGEPKGSNDPRIPRTNVPNHEQLDGVLEPVSRQGWGRSNVSFMTAELELANGHTLDLTHFTGFAEELAAGERDISDIACQVAGRVSELEQQLSERLSHSE
jgi:hypothetical protein